MLIKDVMTRDPLFITLTTPVHDAFALMQQHRIRHLPVLDDGNVVGMISSRELRWICSALATPEQQALQYSPVARLMSTPVLTVDAEEPIEDAARVMRERKVGSLVVLDSEDRMVGIVTSIDVLDAIIQLTGVQAASSRLEVALDNTPGQLARVCASIGETGVNIVSVLTSHFSPDRIHFLFRVATMDVRSLAEHVRSQGFEVLWPPQK